MTPPDRARLDALFTLLHQQHFEEATAVLSELRGQDLSAEDAAELVVAADVFPDAESDPQQLEAAARVLAGAGRWDRAMGGFASAAARFGEDLAGARRSYAAAVGCAEAGTARRLGAALLLRLAEVELRCGSKESAAALCEHALERLKGVKLLGARADEARALELLGDLCAAQHRPEEARQHWQDALERFQRLQHGRAKQVRAKLGG